MRSGEDSSLQESPEIQYYWFKVLNVRFYDTYHNLLRLRGFLGDDRENLPPSSGRKGHLILTVMQL